MAGPGETGFTFETTETIRGFWTTQVKVGGVHVWSSQAHQAEDIYEGTGKGVHEFAYRLGLALEEPPEYDGD